MVPQGVVSFADRLQLEALLEQHLNSTDPGGYETDNAAIEEAVISALSIILSEVLVSFRE